MMSRSILTLILALVVSTTKSLFLDVSEPEALEQAVDSLPNDNSNTNHHTGDDSSNNVSVENTSEDADAPASTADGSAQVQAYERLQNRLWKALHPPQPQPLPPSDVTTTADTEEGCSCSDTGKSGTVNVPYIGCSQHVHGSAAFCFVRTPQECMDFSKESAEFPGARWKLCSPTPKPPNTLSALNVALAQTAAAQAPQAPVDPNTQIKRTEENGMSKYSMAHRGVSTTLVTEGDKQLEGEAGKNRTMDLIKDVKQAHQDVRQNVTAALDQTRESVGQVYNSVNNAMLGAMDAIDVALSDAFKSENGTDTPDKPSTDAIVFKNMFNRIHSRVMASTKLLRRDGKPRDPAIDHMTMLPPGPKETLYDRMLKMSDNIVKKVNRKMDRMSDRMAEKRQQGGGGGGPISVNAKSY